MSSYILLHRWLFQVKVLHSVLRLNKRNRGRTKVTVIHRLRFPVNSFTQLQNLFSVWPRTFRFATFILSCPTSPLPCLFQSSGP